MSTHRAPPGPQVSTGRIRVDAAKALAKLRAYRLTDPTAWILEAIRAAIASGATAIALDGDANDVWLRWSGPAWPAEELPALFDELVSPEQGHDAYHRRLLATAINSALGLAPAWLDVVAVDPGGPALRVRFTPATVIPDEDDAAPRRTLPIDAVAQPTGVGAPGMMVHLRRPAGLEVLARFLRGADPPELQLARDACADVAVPMTIAGAPIGRALAGVDLLREALGEGLTGFVALVDPRAPRVDGEGGLLDLAELGVRVERAPWQLAGPGLVHRHPLRLFVDAPRLPTNASRSQVRLDAHPIEAALGRAAAAVPTLIARLVATLRAAPDERLRAAALALLIEPHADRHWSYRLRALDGPLAELAALPLLRDACGRWRAPSATWGREVYTGAKPLPIELGRWLAPLLWAPPDDPSSSLFTQDADELATRAVIHAARKQRRRHATFLQRPPRPAQVERRAESRVRAPLGAGPAGCVPASVFAELTGEVCVAAGAGRGRLLVLLEGRPLETIALDGPLAIDAVVEGAPLVANDVYTGAVDGDGRRRAIVAAAAGAIRAIEALCVADASPSVTIAAPRRGPDDDALVRGALALAVRAGFTVADDTPLATAPAWPILDGVAQSLAELRRHRAIGVASPGAVVVAPAGRPIAVLAPDDRPLLAALIAPAALVPYEGAHARPSIDPGAALARRQLERTGAATLVIRTATHAGAIAFADHSELALAHRGFVLAEVARTPALVDCAIAIDSDAIVPSPDWRALHDDGGVAAAELAAWEHALVIATVHALLGDATPDLHVPQRPVRLDDATGRGLLAAIASGGLELVGPVLADRLRAHRMFAVLGADRPVSLDELTAAFPTGAIPVVSAASLVEHEPPGDGWAPLVGDDRIRAVVTQLAGRATVDATRELARRSELGMRARRIATLRARPAAPLTLPDECAPIPIGGQREGVIGCALAPVAQLELVFSFEGRPCGRLVSSPDLPARVAVDVDLSELDDDLVHVRPKAHERLLIEARRGVARWLAATAVARPTALADHAPTRALLAAWLARATTTTADPLHDATRETLRRAPAWTMIQGGHGAPPDAVRGAVVEVATAAGAWLPGPPPHALDHPVIALPPGPAGVEVRSILDALGPWLTDDVTDAVRRLQTERRIAQGVIAAPSVPGADPRLTRRLDALDPRHALGVGVITLVDATDATVLLHAEGELRARVAIDVAPPVQLAIESPELADDPRPAAARFAELRDVVQRLAAALVAAVVADPATGELPAWLRRRLRRALLGARLDPAAVAHAPIFETTAGNRASWAELVEQQARFTDVWVVTAPPPGSPLDARRLVVRLDDGELQLGASLGALTLVPAARFLELDRVAAVNRGRPPVASLIVPPAARAGAIAIVELPPGARGDRGVVVPLLPSAAALRGVLAHRAMVPFDRRPDACAWPTLALVEDPGLTPDRTWSEPVLDAVWHALADRIAAASAAATARVVEIPRGALASVTITGWGDDGPPNRAVIGALWIEPWVEDRVGVVIVSTPSGDVELDAPDRLRISGRLLVFPDPPALPSAVAALCRRWHPILRARTVEPPPPVPRPAMPAPLPPALAPAPPPPHPLRELAIALHARLQTLGAAGCMVDRVDVDAGATDAIVAANGSTLRLAGNAPVLRALAAALATGALRADGGVDALAAHALAIIHREAPAAHHAALLALLA